MQRLLRFTAIVGLVLFGSLTASANIITGELWHVPNSVSMDAIPANVPATPADVTFSVNSPFNFFGTSVTVGTWLANGGAFGISENTPGTLASLMSDGTTSTLLNFTGFVTVTNGQTFTVTHDDGLTLIIGGNLVIDEPGPTSPVTDTHTYTGPSGTFAFQLVYGECCGGPAVLQIDLPLSNAAPEPATLALMAFALAGAGWTLRRRG